MLGDDVRIHDLVGVPKHDRGPMVKPQNRLRQVADRLHGV